MADAQPTPETPPVVVPKQADWKGRLAAFAISWTVRLISWTLRFRFDESAQFFAEKNPGPMIFCVWHNRLFLSAVVYQKWQKRIGMKRSLAGLVSASRDGAMLSHVFKSFGITRRARLLQPARGPGAARNDLPRLKRASTLTITPDGPRGPCYDIQHGIMSLAQVTGIPVLPVSFHIRWKIQLKSWDRFQIPLPFTRCDIKVGRTVESRTQHFQGGTRGGAAGTPTPHARDYEGLVRRGRLNAPPGSRCHTPADIPRNASSPISHNSSSPENRSAR